MKNANDFLVEIGCEELPAKLLRQLGESFRHHFERRLHAEKLSFASSQWFATPRRLAVIVHELASQQPEQTIERIGPAISAAFDANHQPTPAGLGFARSCNIEINQLQQKQTEKGLCLVFQQKQIGKNATELLPTIVQQTLEQLPLPRTMRWGHHKTQFIRPIRWIVMLYGNAVIPATVCELITQGYTYGHRFHHPEKIDISHPTNYVEVLEKTNVIVDFQQRRQKIQEQIKTVCPVDSHINFDETLLDEITGLVEWPQALVGKFNQTFLELPPDVLIASLRDNQKSFAIISSQPKQELPYAISPKQLLPYFIFVSNLQDAAQKEVVHGNERVVDARFNDAHFFYKTDLEKPLSYFEDKLKHITFQEKLGTLFDKAQRMKTLAKSILENIDEQSKLLIKKDRKILTACAERAALLAKCDLVSDMVIEFPELQGVMGHYYAHHAWHKFSEQAFNRKDWQQLTDHEFKAIREHYYPRFAGDELPSDLVGCAVALADKIDTLIGIFGIGKKPTGDKDPFSLRRAAIGIVRIIIEKALLLDLASILQMASQNYEKLPAHISNEVTTFINERAVNWYQENGGRIDEWQAACANNVDTTTQAFSLLDIYRRAFAIGEFRKQPESEALITANKRLRNILNKTDDIIPAHFDIKRFKQDAEKNLASALATKNQRIRSHIKTAEYATVLSELAELRPVIDQFFDEVMVMVDETPLRLNRLALLQQLRQLFLLVGDIGLLSG